MKTHNIKIPILLWQRLIRQLYKRGHKERESGAFLLGKRVDNKIRRFVCYDDLDPSSLEKGYINFSGEGYVPLWDYCNANNLSVLADVHTHPGGWTGQSDLDKSHPMIAQIGHIALILPKFATNKFQLLKGIGIHEYLGENKWQTWPYHSRKIRLVLR